MHTHGYAYTYSVTPLSCKGQQQKRNCNPTLKGMHATIFATTIVYSYYLLLFDDSDNYVHD